MSLLLKWLGIGDQRTELEKEKDQAFVRAANALKTLSVRNGSVSLDDSELEDKVREARRKAAVLVQRD
jgi:hypothetical protein